MKLFRLMEHINNRMETESLDDHSCLMNIIDEILALSHEIEFYRFTKENRNYPEFILDEVKDSVRKEYGDVLLALLIAGKYLSLEPLECLEMSYKEAERQYKNGNQNR